ncbi:MAG TPA: DUF3343 domain-containing protein [Clostridiales bacterium]|nr:DUF3343 domain-containing protein [Clostridiales bacterium]
MSSKTVILFHSSNYAMWATDVLTQSQIPNKLIPVPRDLSSECGYCVLIDTADTDNAQDILRTNEIEYDRTHEIVQ